MKTCDDYQLELEQRRRGALSPEAAAEAARHLAGCAVCQRSEQVARSTDALLTASARAAAAQVDWDRLGRAIATEVRAYRSLPWVILGTFVVIGFGAGLAFEPQRWVRGGLTVSAIGVGFAAVCWAYAFFKLRAARRATAAGGEELLAYRRRELDLQIKEARAMWFYGPVASIACFVGAVYGWDNEHHAGVALLAVGLLCVWAMVHYVGFELPRLRRERAELA